MGTAKIGNTGERATETTRCIRIALIAVVNIYNGTHRHEQYEHTHMCIFKNTHT